MNINGYKLIGELSHENSGFSKWGFCKKGGKEFFIKEFLSPTYPYKDENLTDKQIERKIKECRDFEDRLSKMYNVINYESDGNVVRIHEFFRFNSKYYIVTEKVQDSGLTVEEVSKLPYPAKKFLCRLIVHSLLGLHEEGFIHGDIKPNNVLIIVNKEKKKYSAKIIDFDCGFFGTEPPVPGEEINGDPIYFAPEVILHMLEEDVALSCKIDVFSLGILFHQYMSGRQPVFDTDEYDYVAEAILDGASVEIDESIPGEFADILRKMLIERPSERISLYEIYTLLSDTTSERDYVPTTEVTNREESNEPEETYVKIKIYNGNK